MTARVAELQDQADTVTRRVELERQKVAELHASVRDTQARLDSKRKQIGSFDGAQNHAQVRRQVRMLEHRCDCCRSNQPINLLLVSLSLPSHSNGVGE